MLRRLKELHFYSYHKKLHQRIITTNENTYNYYFIVDVLSYSFKPNFSE